MKNGAEKTNKNRETMKTGAEKRKENSLKNEAQPIGILCMASYCMGLICASKSNAVVFLFIRPGALGAIRG